MGPSRDREGRRRRLDPGGALRRGPLRRAGDRPLPGGARLSGAELDKLDEPTLARVIGGISVFARTSPAQKLRVVQALQAGGQGRWDVQPSGLFVFRTKAIKPAALVLMLGAFVEWVMARREVAPPAEMQVPKA